MIPHSRPSLESEDLTGIAETLRSGQIAQGPRVERFERHLAAWLGRAGGVAASSGTAALELALRALGVGPADEVIMPSYVCAAPWHAAARLGATPRLVDISLDTFNLDPQAVARARTPRTRAIIVPHLFGLPADLPHLADLGVPLIEDCAQTLGAQVQGRTVGTVGRLTVCSFYATKLLCAGEGGMVLADEPELLARLRTWRAYDERPALTPGSFNYKLTDMQAALGLSQLARLPAFLARRATIAEQYSRGLKDLAVGLPVVPSGSTHAFYRYVLRVRAAKAKDGSRDLVGLLGRLERRGVQCRRPVFRPLHQYDQYDGEAGQAFPCSDEAWATAISIPLYPSLTDEDVARVLQALHEELA